MLRPFTCKRALHAAAALPFKETSGVGKFLSPKSLDLMMKLQNDNIRLLNRNVKGTALERLSLFQLLEKIHSESANADLFATASQIWNTDFFLQGLTNEPVAMTDKVIMALEASFGSVLKFKELFTTYSAVMNGSGWLWLVQDKREGKERPLKIACSFNTGMPLFEAAAPPSINLGSSKASMSAPTNSSSLFASFSFNNTGSGRSVPPEVEALTNSIEVPNRSSFGSPIESKVPSHVPVMPVLGINLWEHAYLLDYGHDKRRYVNEFWSAVNWNRVAILLKLY